MYITKERKQCICIVSYVYFIFIFKISARVNERLKTVVIWPLGPGKWEHERPMWEGDFSLEAFS